jgi:hypothetical protein
MASPNPSTNDQPRLDDGCLQRMRDLCSWWSEAGAFSDCPSLDLRQRLQELRPHLALQLESQSGLASPLLLAELDQLTMRLGTCVPGQVCWINLSHTIGMFLSELSKLGGASCAK